MYEMLLLVSLLFYVSISRPWVLYTSCRQVLLVKGERKNIIDGLTFSLSLRLKHCVLSSHAYM